jgi:hypothetical protein
MLLDAWDRSGEVPRRFYRRGVRAARGAKGSSHKAMTFCVRDFACALLLSLFLLPFASASVLGPWGGHDISMLYAPALDWTTGLDVLLGAIIPVSYMTWDSKRVTWLL